MHVKIYWIGEGESGRLGTMARPRGGDWLEDEVRSLREQGVDVVASLLEPEEVAELELTQEPALCEACGICYLSLPVRDYGVPSAGAEFERAVETLAGHLASGRSVVVHCRQGIGRSSVLAASILIKRGVPVNHAWELVASARGRSVPDTAEQMEWVRKFAEDA